TAFLMFSWCSAAAATEKFGCVSFGVDGDVSESSRLHRVQIIGAGDSARHAVDVRLHGEQSLRGLGVSATLKFLRTLLLARGDPAFRL
ncbi:MAG: hypothetical protein ACM3VW_11210, partial [Bacteroidota bacterium]